MKIAIVTHNVRRGDGQGRVNYELARYLLRRGAEVHLVADRVAPDLLDAGARWLPVHPDVDGIDLVKVWRFRRLADRALAASNDTFDMVMGCGVTLGVPHAFNAVHFVHGTWLRSPFHASRVRPGFNGSYQWLCSTLNARWELETFRRSEVVIAVSEMVRRELVEIGVPADKVRVVVNGVDVHEFYPGPVDRAGLGLPEQVFLGLFVGDIQSPIKNLDAVLRAMVDVPDMHLAVAGRIGTSPYPDMAAGLGIQHRVHFLDFRTDVAELMRAADVFLLPSRRDSCPLVLLEAMASGLPAVTSRMVGTANLVEDVCGFVLRDPDDMETLVKGLATLARDPEGRVSMGRAARRVAESHSWERMAEQYYRYFEAYLRAPALVLAS